MNDRKRKVTGTEIGKIYNMIKSVVFSDTKYVFFPAPTSSESNCVSNNSVQF